MLHSELSKQATAQDGQLRSSVERIVFPVIFNPSCKSQPANSDQVGQKRIVLIIAPGKLGGVAKEYSVAWDLPAVLKAVTCAQFEITSTIHH